MQCAGAVCKRRRRRRSHSVRLHQRQKEKEFCHWKPVSDRPSSQARASESRCAAADITKAKAAKGEPQKVRIYQVGTRVKVLESQIEPSLLRFPSRWGSIEIRDHRARSRDLLDLL